MSIRSDANWYDMYVIVLYDSVHMSTMFPLAYGRSATGEGVRSDVMCTRVWEQCTVYT